MAIGMTITGVQTTIHNHTTTITILTTHTKMGGMLEMVIMA